MQFIEPEPDFEHRDFLQQGGSLLVLFVAGSYERNSLDNQRNTYLKKYSLQSLPDFQLRDFL